MAAADTPLDRLLSLVRFAFDHVTGWEDHCGVYVDYFSSGGRDDGAAFSLSSIYTAVEDIIRRLIEEGQASGEIDADIEPGATAELLVSFFDGVVLHGVFSERRSNAESLRSAALRLLTCGVLAGSPVLRAQKSDDERLESG